MTNTPTHAAAIQDEHIADLRAALQRAVALIQFEAGREAATDPGQADRLIAAADGMADVLARTGLPAPEES